MGISDWFTIISILSVFLGFLIQNELRLFIAKLGLAEKIIVGYVLLIQLPILLFYSELSTFFTFLKDSPFVYKHGIMPEKLAFILVLSFFAHILIRLYWLIPKNRMAPHIFAIYSSIAEQNKALLPVLINKYESADFITENWSMYEIMFQDEIILNFLSINVLSYY